MHIDELNNIGNDQINDYSNLIFHESSNERFEN